MSTLTWNGGSHRFFWPGAWTPNAAPVSGDTVFIGSGTAVVQGGLLSDLTIRLDAPYGPAYTYPLPQIVSGPGPVLKLEHSTIGADTMIVLGATLAGGTTTATIEADGRTVNDGTITAGAIAYAGPPDGAPTTLTIDVGGARGGLLVNQGTLSVTPQTVALSQMIVHGESCTSRLENDGVIRSQGTISLDIDVIGRGTITFGAYYMATHDGPPISGTVEMERAVGQGQTVDFATGTGSDTFGALILDHPAGFHGVISDFSAGPAYDDLHPDEIVLPSSEVTGLSYRSDASGGVLTLKDGCATVAHIRFAGSYTANEFEITHPTASGSIIELRPGT